MLASEFLLTWAAGLVVGDFGGSRGGIYVARSDGSDMKQITVSQTNNYQFSGDGLNMPDDHPSFSPDGKQIVFTTSRWQTQGQSNNFEIAVMNVDGTNVRRLTNSPGMDTEPVFSPDGKKIAFSSDRGGDDDLDIWVMNADGTNLVQLTNSVDEETEPAWSHAGTRLAYSRVLFAGVGQLFGSEKNVYVINADGTGNTLIAGNNFEEHDAVFSLDDSKLIMTSEKVHTLPFGNVCVIDIASKKYVSNLTVEDSFLGIGGGGDPSLSPDGTKIAYFKSTGGPLLLAGPQTLFIMNANGTGKTKIPAPGIINVHSHLGRAADTDLDGVPDYLDVNSPAAFQIAIAQDESRVRDFLGGLDKISTAAGIAALAVKGYFPGHNFNSFQGLGVAFARDINLNDPSQLGKPDVLYYAPDLSPNILGNTPDVTDAFGDYPYRFIGWGYTTIYDPTHVPTFGGWPADAWGVHEAGFYNIVGGTFTPTPPANDVPRGSKPMNTRPSGNAGTPWHERLWNINFFASNVSGGAPKSSLFDPFGRNLPGFATGASVGFFPQIPYDGSPIDPRHVEAEDFDMNAEFGWHDNTSVNSGGQYRVTGVDISKTLDGAVGNDVVSLQAGEFMQYSLDIPAAGNYEFAIRLANGRVGGKYHVEIDGTNRSGLLDVPVTSGIANTYATFVPFSTFIALPGTHRVRVVIDTEPTDPGGSPISRPQFRFNSFSLNLIALPTATMTPLSTIRKPTDSILVNIDFSDSSAINVNSIDGNDLRITGPNGMNQPLAFVSKTESTNAAAVTATYRFSPGGSGFDPADNGAYTVLLNGQQVGDLGGRSAAAGTLGTILISIPRFQATQNPLTSLSTLQINGGESPEPILVSMSGTTISASINGVVVGTADARTIDSLFVSGGGGDDAISLAGVNIPAVIEGNAGNDAIQGGSAIDTIRGGLGDDIVRSATVGPDGVDLGEQTGTAPQGVVFDGTAGNDTIRVKRVVVNGIASIVFETSFGSFRHPIANCNTVIVNGLAGNDEIVIDPSAGDKWRAQFDGGAGRDVLIGSRKNDTLLGGDGNDWLDGGSGLDVLLGGNGDDSLVGGTGLDWLDGGTGRDFAKRDTVDLWSRIEGVF